MIVVAMVAPAWLMVGAVLGVVEARGGGWRSARVVSAVLGPFAIPVRRMTLATVLDIDTAAPHADSLSYPQPWPEGRRARELLDAAAVTLRVAW